MENTINVAELSTQTLEAMKGIGLSDSSLAYNCSIFQTICCYHEQYGKAYYDAGTMTQFRSFTEKLLENDKITRNYYNSLIRGVNLLEEFHGKGTVEWGHRPKGSKVALSDYYENLLKESTGLLTLSESTLEGMRSMLRKYLSFLESQGHTDVSSINAKAINDFIVTSGKSGRSLHALKYYMKKFHIFLRDTKGVCIPFDEILSIPPVFNMKIGAYTSRAELSLILEQIKIDTSIGKRDKAILLLAADTGLRTIDIINLKLQDIDWRRFELRIIQQKKERPVSVPLMPDAAEAIKDYILNGRPQSESPQIFLRTRAPYQRISKGVAVIHILEKYQKSAGIMRSPFDGKGMHSLRRGMGRGLLIAGVSVEMIAQVLDHKNIESTKPYLPLDTENLRECAIEFAGIEVSKEAMAYA